MTATDQATQFKYTPRYQPNQLICGNGQTAVVTGWTVKQAIAKHLQPQEFAVIGQLYSPTRGISFLVRNLLANPHVRYLVILNATKEDGNAGACECLLDFFRNGFVEGSSDTGRKCWVIRSAVRGYIDIEIDATALEQLRECVKCEEVKSIAQAVNQVKFYAQQGIVKPWGQQREFPYSTLVPSVLPGQRYGHRIEGKTIAETWVKIIHRIKTTGTIRPSRYDSQWQELIDLTAIVTQEPQDFYFPEPNYLPCDRSFINQYISQILGDSSQEKASSEEVIEYTYGQRLRSWFERDQIEQVIQKLSHQIDSASAVMSLWDVRDHETDKSPPCLNHIWVRVVDNELSLTATFRSNDMFSAWPANAIGLRALQQYIRDAIAKRCCDSEAVATLGASAQIAARSKYDLKMGPLITVSQSAHIYDDCWENADQLIQSQYFRICQQRDYADPSGNFVITLRDGTICVEHMTPGSGEVVNCYSGKSASQLYRQIAADCPSLQVEHAMYLGTELQKAELSLSAKQGFVYEQDKPLMLTEKLTSIDNQVLKVKLLSEKAQLPQYAHPGDSGLDLFSIKDAVIQPGESTLIPTGISIELPPETEAQIRPRSGLALKHQVTVLNTPGTIDQGYRGEIGVILINHGKLPFHVEIGMKIAQMVIQPLLSVKVKNVEELDKTDRGAGGFGSTGI